MSAEDYGRTAKIIGDITKERERQKTAEGWTPEHDNTHQGGELAIAAACYAVEGADAAVVGEEYEEAWPWSKRWDKRDKHDERRRLVIAAALLVAEIERLDRAKAHRDAGLCGSVYHDGRRCIREAGHEGIHAMEDKPGPSSAGE